MKNQEKQNIKNLLNQLDINNSKILNDILRVQEKANEERLKALKECEKLDNLTHNLICERWENRRNKNAEEVEKLTLELNELTKQKNKFYNIKVLNENIERYINEVLRNYTCLVGYEVLLLINEKCKNKSDLVAFNSLLKWEENNFSYYISYNYNNNAYINIRECKKGEYLNEFKFCESGDFKNLSSEIVERVKKWQNDYKKVLNTFEKDYLKLFKHFESMKKLQEKQTRENEKLFHKHEEERTKKDYLNISCYLK